MEDITLILEDRKKYEAVQQFKTELRKQEQYENFKKKVIRVILALIGILALIVYATVCMTI